MSSRLAAIAGLITTAVIALSACGGASGGASGASTSGASASLPNGLWTGTVYGHQVDRLTFRIGGGRISNVLFPGVGCFAYPSGYQIQTIIFPISTAIPPSGNVTLVRHPVAGATDTFTATVRGATASGWLKQTGACDTGWQPWVARPGSTPPAAPSTIPPTPAPAPLPGGCSAASCPATDGLILSVTGVDRTLTSSQDPNAGPYASTVDPALAQTGGMLVNVRVTNPTASAINIVTSGGEWSLRDGAGHVEASRLENDLHVTVSDGRLPTDANTCHNDLVTIPSHGTSAPFSLCFAVPAAARSGSHLLFDYPTTMASVPLG